MSNPTSNFGWVMPTSTDLVTDLPADFAVFGQGVDTTMADLKGGTTGQILSKATNTDMDFVWTNAAPGDITGVTAGTGITGGGTSGTVTVTNDMATTITTSGDLISGTGSGTYTRRGIGSTGQVLTVSGGVPAWTTPSSGSMTLLQTFTFDNTVTNYTYSSIPSTYTNLLVIGSGIQFAGTAAESGPINIVINGDTGSNYNGQQIRANPTLSQNSGNGAAFDIGIVGANTTDSSIRFGQFALTIYGYASSTLYKAMTSFGCATNDNVFKQNISMCQWNNTAAITSLKFIDPYAKNFKAGTIRIYGVN